ncbi:MAG: phage integrase N-terminal SAM-like domain-containing protein [Gammaproteobacteria bacterium]|nr:phage integrase N-terminal SAM-like domain-containing protein [Gammaproteobacteria bacterium]
MTQLRQRMIDEMVLRGFSPRTHQSYLAAVSQLSQYYHRSPDKLTDR